MKYFDRVNKNTHILQVDNPTELFAIITNLNKLDSVVIAKPIVKRVYKKGYKKPTTNLAKGRTTNKDDIDKKKNELGNQ